MTYCVEKWEKMSCPRLDIRLYVLYWNACMYWNRHILFNSTSLLYVAQNRRMECQMSRQHALLGEQGWVSEWTSVWCLTEHIWVCLELMDYRTEDHSTALGGQKKKKACVIFDDKISLTSHNPFQKIYIYSVDDRFWAWQPCVLVGFARQPVLYRHCWD